MLNLIAIGTVVQFGPANLDATITAISIRECDKVQYELVYWVGEERKEIWVSKWEFRLTTEATKDHNVIFGAENYAPTQTEYYYHQHEINNGRPPGM